MPRLLYLLLLFGAPLAAQENASPAGKDHQISIFFGGGSYYIDANQAARLQEFLDGIPSLEGYEVELQGHTDDIGNRAYNLRLSEFRNQAVRDRLIDSAVPPEIIDMLPLGEDAPSFDNGTWEGKLSNRRVDIIFKRVIL